MSADIQNAQSMDNTNHNTIDRNMPLRASQNRNNSVNTKGASDQLIDLENQDLNYTQIRQIRFGVQKDVELLRNRIRMLQAEKEKSRKKIGETQKRTRQIRDQIYQNDLKYHQNLQIESQRKNFTKAKLVDRKKIE